MTKLTIAIFLLASAGSGQAEDCSREALKAMAAHYFTAVETHGMSVLPMAANVRITENAVEVKPGEGFFKTGGKAQLERTIVDTGHCSTLTQAVVEETVGGKSGPRAYGGTP